MRTIIASIVIGPLLLIGAQSSSYANEFDPGFNPDTGQINRGFDPKMPSSSPSPRAIPSPAEARAAFFASESTASTGAGGAGPIGATPQTMPASLSQRNDTLDWLPTMAWPLGLSDQQRQRIYQAIMVDKNAPATDAGNLARTSVLPTQVALNETYDFPSSFDDIAGLRRLKYVKTKDKVLLVVPTNRIVVDVIPD